MFHLHPAWVSMRNCLLLDGQLQLYKMSKKSPPSYNHKMSAIFSDSSSSAPPDIQRFPAARPMNHGLGVPVALPVSSRPLPLAIFFFFFFFRGKTAGLAP